MHIHIYTICTHLLTIDTHSCNTFILHAHIQEKNTHIPTRIYATHAHITPITLNTPTPTPSYITHTYTHTTTNDKHTHAYTKHTNTTYISMHTHITCVASLLGCNSLQGFYGQTFARI